MPANTEAPVGATDLNELDFERIGEELLGIANLASSLIDRADALRQEIGRAPGDITRPQREQLANMRARGWDIRVTDQIEDQILIVEGVDPTGDRFRGHLTDRGVFSGSPTGVGRPDQRVGIGAPLPVGPDDFSVRVTPAAADDSNVF